MKKRSIFIASLTAFLASLATVPANAQLFRACPSGACPNYNRVRVVQYQRVYNPYAYQAAQRVAPCEPIQTTVEPCAPTAETVEVSEPCAPVQATVEPCAPVATCDEYIPTETGTIICENGTCPIRTAVKATTKTAARAVQEVAATARFLLAVNRVRMQYNLPTLKADANLDAGCESQAAYCSRVGQLVHGGNSAEILAYNYSGFDAALIQWLNSPAHRSLLLAPNFRTAGVAVVRGADGRVWCAMRFR